MILADQISVLMNELECQTQLYFISSWIWSWWWNFLNSDMNIRPEKLSLITWKMNIALYMQKGHNCYIWGSQLIQLILLISHHSGLGDICINKCYTCLCINCLGCLWSFWLSSMQSLSSSKSENFCENWTTAQICFFTS